LTPGEIEYSFIKKEAIRSSGKAAKNDTAAV
jgi:hypothetical protein